MFPDEDAQGQRQSSDSGGGLGGQQRQNEAVLGPGSEGKRDATAELGSPEQSRGGKTRLPALGAVRRGSLQRGPQPQCCAPADFMQNTRRDLLRSVVALGESSLFPFSCEKAEAQGSGGLWMGARTCRDPHHCGTLKSGPPPCRKQAKKGQAKKAWSGGQCRAERADGDSELS